MSGRGAYLLHLLLWGGPVLVLQLLALGYRYRGALGRVLRRVVPPALAVSAWLVFADHLAIRSGIWHFGAGKHLGISLLGVPVEEILFFVLTNLLVAFGLALFHRPPQGRVPA